MRFLPILLASLSAACAATAEDSAGLVGAAESDFSTERLGAQDGSFQASVVAVEGRGRVLSVTYRESIDSDLLLCRLFPRQPSASLVFVLGAEGARTSLSRPMRVDCPRSWGDNPGSSNSASFSVWENEDPALWETLFPLRADGTRWYAAELALANAHGSWDSRHGANYHLVLR